LPGQVPPLRGVRVLDFSTLLPGPFATLLMAEAGATVIKIEKPAGDEMRRVSATEFAMLNAGKTGVVADLRDPADRERVLDLCDGADVLVEQFRPGVMERLGLGYEQVAARNPRLVYCSVTGFGQTGPRRGRTGHDLNYVAATGLLGVVRDGSGRPALPHVTLADVSGGSYPALLNILMALAARSVTGRGSRLDVSMADNLWPLQYWTLESGLRGESPPPGAGRLTGGSPRYQVYETADGRFVAATPLEQRFWDAFCDVVGLHGPLRDDSVDPAATMTAVRAAIAGRDGAHWQRAFEETDCACTLVADVAEAVADPDLRERHVLEPTPDGRSVRMPSPLARQFRHRDDHRAPALGELPLEAATWATAAAHGGSDIRH
jgi:crotonobetainyl-CoA:carnitine CoA-transferase CaiB-like acyl-CoA transferase